VTVDEFGLLHENIEEAGLDVTPPPVRRVTVPLPDGRHLSAIAWGDDDPEVVLLHGGAQNAHTWDTVALALGRPLVAIDLPGHGRSGWRDDGYSPTTNADDVAVAVEALAPAARQVVGMSLGGLTSLALAARHPGLVRRLLLVDVTPGVDREKAEPILAFISGPEVFASFDEILERTVQFNPTRSVSSLRRGILHNAVEQADGTWRWRWDHRFGSRGGVGDMTDLWAAIERLDVPLLLVRGGTSGVVSDDDVAELLRRKPDASVVVVEGAGHSVQGDEPVALAQLIGEFLRQP
jgi:pimeloyl-ACP methyl ester carboxylesterase